VKKRRRRTKSEPRPWCVLCRGQGYVPSERVVVRNGLEYPEGNIVCVCRTIPRGGTVQTSAVPALSASEKPIKPSPAGDLFDRARRASGEREEV
jgi:hypothetical protein